MTSPQVEKIHSISKTLSSLAITTKLLRVRVNWFLFGKLPKCNESISHFTSDDVNTALWYRKPTEIMPYVQRIGRPRQILQANDDAHLWAFFPVKKKNSTSAKMSAENKKKASAAVVLTPIVQKQVLKSVTGRSWCRDGFRIFDSLSWQQSR